MKILVINPGSTSTKIAVYENLTQVFIRTIRHCPEELSAFRNVSGQYSFRKEILLKELREEGISLNFNAVIGRGGLLRPIRGGVYEVNDKMVSDLLNARRQHASNLGGLLANEIASRIPGCKAFIADPVVVDELEEVARISGLPFLPRISIFHALNQKATARKYARESGREYDRLNLIVAHMGGGISVAAHRKGKIVDVNNAIDGEGPFTPERAGTLPAGQLVELCFCGKYTQDEINKFLNGKGGLMAHLGSTDVEAITEATQKGDPKSKLIMDAMIYTISKSIGAMAIPLSGKIDGILLTGGIAFNRYVTTSIGERVSFMAPVIIYPGENEMEALAHNAFQALTGASEVLSY